MIARFKLAFRTSKCCNRYRKKQRENSKCSYRLGKTAWTPYLQRIVFSRNLTVLHHLSPPYSLVREHSGFVLEILLWTEKCGFKHGKRAESPSKTNLHSPTRLPLQRAFHSNVPSHLVPSLGHEKSAGGFSARSFSHLLRSWTSARSGMEVRTQMVVFPEFRGPA